MLKALIVTLFLCWLVVSVSGGCSGSPPTFNGLPCASTTRYWDDQMGACGCGNGATPYSWNGQAYTAAASQLLFDSSGSSWCGVGCGSCYQITPTGDCPTGGPCATSTSSITIMITNLCPNNGNAVWCPNPGNANQYGYHQHFDLNDPNMAGWVDSMGWNNPVVTYKAVSCGSGGAPTCAEYATCECNVTGCSGGGGAAASSSHASSSSSSTHGSSSSTATHASSSSTASSSHSSSSSSSTSGSTGTCTATVTAVYSTFNGGGNVVITVKNTGTSALKKVYFTITGTIASPYGITLVSGTEYDLASYSLPLAAGASASGGFGYTGSAEPSVALVSGSASC